MYEFIEIDAKGSENISSNQQEEGITSSPEAPITTKIDSSNPRAQQSFKSPTRTKLKGFVNPNSNHLKQTISS